MVSDLEHLNAQERYPMAQLVMSLVAASTSPEESLWISELAAELNTASETHQWGPVLGRLELLHIWRPGYCYCGPREQRDWLHQFHGEYNRRIKAAINLIPGVRAGVRRALYDDLTAPCDSEALTGRVFINREQGNLLLDFLRVKPRLEWF